MTATAARVTSTPARRPGARSRTQRLRAWFQPQVSIGVREQRDQAVLLLAVAVAVLPHFDHLPLWSIAVLGGLWIWRAWLAQSLKPAPSRVIVVALLLLLTTAVWTEHGTLWGRDASVHFLLVLIGLKILEMRARRDVFVIVFLSLFVLETQFLFDQSPYTALVMLAAVGMLFFVLLSVSLPEGDISIRGKMRYLARVFVLALPLTLTMFFLFPRLPTPLWSLTSNEQVNGTGLSDSMRPGSIRNLLRNDAVALRAKFDWGVPPERYLYWRGPVFGSFDGETWLPIEPLRPDSSGPLDIQVDPRSGVDYTVTLEATQRRDLIGLDFAAVVDGVPTAHGRLTPTLQLLSATPVNARRRYEVRSYTTYTVESKLDPAALSDWLQLPPRANPRTRGWAAELKTSVLSAAGTAKSAPDQQLVDAVLEHFRREPFRYSLQPGTMSGDDAIDQFLFDKQVGLCEHYASAFVFLMRVLGVPARVVTGYQGGEINPVDGFLTVRQSDAHAWAEVWLLHRGWVRVDPTAAVAPERVDHTLGEQRADDLNHAGRSGSWMHQWRLNREAIENAWNQWFLSYSPERQRAFVGWMGLQPGGRNIAFVAIGAFSALLVLLTLASLRHPRKRDPLAELVFRLRRKLARAGIEIPPNMGLSDMERHLDGRLEAASLDEARPLLQSLGKARYAPASSQVRTAEIADLRRRLRRWRAVPLAA
jgi:transglutaminase-like putative cysteine protease